MAFPTLLYVITQIAILVVGVPIVYLLSKGLRLHAKPIAIQDPRKETRLVSLVIVAVFAAVAIWNAVGKSVFQIDPSLTFFDVPQVLGAAFFFTILLLLMAVAMKRTGQNLGSIGISRKNRGRMIALGLIVSAIYFSIVGLYSRFTGFSTSLVYGFIYFAINSFSEEIVMRGYVQTRLVAYRGTLKGWAVTALLFSFWHFPVRYYQLSGVVLEALASVLLLLPISLLLGYIMLRSQNILPSSIYHLFYNWATIFWQAPPA